VALAEPGDLDSKSAEDRTDEAREGRQVRRQITNDLTYPLREHVENGSAKKEEEEETSAFFMPFQNQKNARASKKPTTRSVITSLYGLDGGLGGGQYSHDRLDCSSSLGIIRSDQGRNLAQNVHDILLDLQ